MAGNFLFFPSVMNNLSPKHALLFVAGLVVSVLALAGTKAAAAPPAVVADVAVPEQLKPGANVLPYEIHNAASGEEYCQMCAYAERAGTVAAYGNLHDEQFWGDLEKLQALQDSHKNFGFFGQVLDSTDGAAIVTEAKKHHLTIPVVYAVDPDWNGVYKVGGVSRTIYYSNRFKILWTGIGLDGGAVAKLGEAIKSNPQG